MRENSQFGLEEVFWVPWPPSKVIGLQEKNTMKLEQVSFIENVSDNLFKKLFLKNLIVKDFSIHEDQMNLGIDKFKTLPNYKENIIY